MIPASLLLVLTGIVIIVYAFRKSSLSFKSVLHEYKNSRLIYLNLINLLFLYLLVPMLVYVFDPLGMKHFVIGFNLEGLAYEFMLTHLYLIRFADTSLILSIIIALVGDFVLFAVMGFLSVAVTGGRKTAILINFLLFYVFSFMLNMVLL